MNLSAEQEEIILERQRAYKAGDMEVYTVEELKAFLDYAEQL